MATIRKLRGRWQAQGRRRGLAPRAKSFDLRADAEKWARTLEAEIDRVGILADTRLAERMSVRDMLERYLAEVTPHKRSADVETYRVKALMRREISHRTLAMLTPVDIAQYRDERLKTVATSTVLKELNTLAHAIDIARKEWGVNLAQNPCRMIRRPKAPRGRDRRLQPGEEQKLLDAADAGRSPWMRPLIILALETAARQGELLALRWEHVDLRKRIAHLPLTKNGDSRDLPLPRESAAALDRTGSPQPGRGSPTLLTLHRTNTGLPRTFNRFRSSSFEGRGKAPSAWPLEAEIDRVGVPADARLAEPMRVRHMQER